MGKSKPVNTRPLKLQNWVELSRVALDAGLTPQEIREAKSLTALRLSISLRRPELA